MKSPKKPVSKELKIKDTNKNIEQPIKNNHFPIVGIGASAGGLEALEQFFVNVDTECGMAFVVIQHLSPDHKGMMAELIQRITKMQVFTATDQLTIEPNCIYIIPPNKSMSILNGALYLFESIESHGLHLPIDFFFRSLAEDRKEESIGIILSGMGSDGSLGIQAIKEKAGIVLVQEPSSAKFDSMPRSAIDACLVDIVAPANELAAKLKDIHTAIPQQNITSVLEKDSSSLDKIIILLRSRTGNDFSQYKKNTIYRRIERRMNIHQINKIASYVRYLRQNPIEIDILFKELLIGVTNFFRDTYPWEYLKNKVLPKMLAEFPDDYEFRAWVPACSTGEEAYSLAIIFKEALDAAQLKNNIKLQIFATDLDSGAIEKARKAVYPSNIVFDVSPARLSRFFVKIDDQYRVNTEIREMVVFAPQNVIKDPPFTKLDLLSCRNMLIYMNAELQKKLLTLFHYSLNKKGILLLGSAETNTDNKDYYNAIDSKLRIYQKIDDLKPDELTNFPTAFASTKMKDTHKPTTIKVSDNIQSVTDHILLQQYIPASVLVNKNGDILYLTGNTGKYLTPAAGKASFNIFSMAREGLRNALPIAFRKAMQNFDKIVLKETKVGTNGGTLIVDVSIQQIENPTTVKGKFLIVFSDVSLEKPITAKSKKHKTTSNLKQLELETEIQQLTEELQTTREEMQTSQEELKSTNEELQSSNEELQSTNEELTTSKEEMQSLNEELHTVNTELQSKIDDSLRISNDMSNLLNSSEIATLFLDRDLKIRQFTAHTTKIFKLIKSDIGRHFTDLATNLNYPEMHEDTQEVLRTLVFSEKTVSTNDGAFFTVRIMPYRTFDDKIDGLVITFIDATKSKRFELALKGNQKIIKTFIQKVPSIIIGISLDGKIVEFNPEAEKVTGYKRFDIINRNYFDLLVPEQYKGKVESQIKELFQGIFPQKFKTLLKSASNKQITIEWTAHQSFNIDDELDGIILLAEKTML